jgi:hypothetical protein
MNIIKLNIPKYHKEQWTTQIEHTLQCTIKYNHFNNSKDSFKKNIPAWKGEQGLL